MGPPAPGASTRSPSSNDAGWTNSANAYTSNNSYATSAVPKNQTTSVKVGTFGFSSTIPANATITGVTVSVEWKVSTTSSNATLGAQAWVSGAGFGSELVNAAEPMTDTTQSFAVSGLTRAQLLDGVFQVRVRATRGSSNNAVTASLDAVTVQVTYTASDTVTMTTNADGNLVVKGSSTFAYDQANRLTSATVAGTTETYAYDGDGVRYSRTVGANPAIRYVTDVNTSLPITLDDGTRKYVWGLGLAYAVSGSSVEIYHTDRLGSVRAITDASGAVTATYRTDEYGVPDGPSGSTTQPFGFTGEPRDMTGLSYLRARYYDPSLGRFMSRDTWAGDRLVPASLNRFTYAGNNPTRWADPSGRCLPPTTVLCIGGVAVGAEAAGAFLTWVLGLGATAVILSIPEGQAASPPISETREDPTTPRPIPGIDPGTWDQHLEIVDNMYSNPTPPLRLCTSLACRMALVAAAGGTTFVYVWEVRENAKNALDNRPQSSPPISSHVLQKPPHYLP